tara:strand:+ start:147 stop:437 length:291 start_codon:yes stop_codon:yes gene_type:complete
MNIYYEIKRKVLLRVGNISHGYCIICPNEIERRRKLMSKYILTEILLDTDKEYTSIIKYDRRDIDHISIDEIDGIYNPWKIKKEENRYYEKYYLKR